jgi:RNA polymerase sigma-70 factor (ECF subfamily)
MPRPHPSADDVSQDVPARLAAARAGSQEALGELLQTCRQYLLLVANSELDANLRVKVGASDLVQETFLEAQQAFGRFHGSSEEDLLAWLRCILVNNLTNYARRYRGTDKRDLRREVSLDAEDSARRNLKANLTAAAALPGEGAEHREQARALEEALGRLPAHYRTVIALRHQERCSFAEVGRRLGRTEDAARMLWTRAVKQLRQEYESLHERS